MMLNFEQYLAERTGSSAGQQTKRKVNIEELKQMIANKDSDIAGVDVSEIKDMFNLFEDSDFGGSWTADLSGWDTSSVTDMSNMFDGCTNLKEVSLPHTENVTNMSNMFRDCTNLKEVSLPHTEKVTCIGDNIRLEMIDNMMRHMAEIGDRMRHMDRMRRRFTDIYSMDGGMFEGCVNLTKVELPTLNTSNLEDMSMSFYRCSSLEKVPFDLNKLKKTANTTGMFNGCTKLISQFSK